MSLILLNGSPRGNKSNSKVMLKWLKEGYGENLDIFNLNIPSKFPAALEACYGAGTIFLILPLYVDGMPAQVMKFLETLYLDKEKVKGKKVCFFIHSGFPAAKQSYSLRDVLENIASKFEFELLPTIIMGGSEGVRLMPDSYQKKNKNAIVTLGQNLRNREPLNQEALHTLASPEKLSLKKVLMNKFLSKTGLLNLYWNNSLKRNKAFNKRFDKPYINN
jgi:multimeric flavodoxin WrbA